MKYDGLVIADIHFGATDPRDLLYGLTNSFIYYMKNLKKLDFLIIDGDYFDYKIYLNESIVTYAINFMDQLVSYAKEMKFPIRIIYGTESHEVNQYNIFSLYENDNDVDFKIIYTVTEEDLFPDMKVLYVPEEYITSKHNFYEKYLYGDTHYNYIFGHGTIGDMVSYKVYENTGKKESERKKPAVFKAAELANVADKTLFGHYHLNTNYQDKVYYVGSFERWQFGEDPPKGFYHLTYDSKSGEYEEKFIENQYAKKYITFIYGYNSPVYESEDKLIQDLSKKDNFSILNDGDHIRFIFNIPENHPNPEFIIRVLNERYKHNDRIQVKITNGYIDKKKKANKEQLSTLINEYPLIFDKSAKLEDKLFYYIKKKNNREIPLERIKLHLYGKQETID